MFQFYQKQRLESRWANWGKLGIGPLIQKIVANLILTPMRPFLWFFLCPKIESEVDLKGLVGCTMTLSFGYDRGAIRGVKAN